MKAKLLFFGLMLSCVLPALSQAPQVTKAQQLLRQDKPQEAIVELRQAVSVNPRNFEAWLLLGEAFLRTNQPDSALFAGRKARDIEGKNPAGYVLTSRAEAAKKDFKAAYASVRNGLKSSRSNNSDLLVQQGLLHLALDSTSQAKISFSQAKEANPQNAKAYEGLGEAWMREGSPGMAIRQMETYIQYDSSDAELMEKLANTLKKERRYTEAARWYNRVVRLDTTKAAPLFEMSELYFKGKQYLNASRAFQIYTRRFPNNDAAWKYYMEALYLSRQYKDALTAAERVHMKEPNSPKVVQIIAHSNYETKQYDMAIASYQRLGAVDTLSLEDKERFGKAFIQTKQDSLAVPILVEVIKVDTTQADVYGDLGGAYMRLKKWERATWAFEKRFKLEPGNNTAYFYYGIAAYQFGRYDSARVALRKVVELKPDNLSGYLYLGLCLGANKDSSSAALKAYETVIKLADTSATKYKNELALAHGRIGLIHLLDKRYPQALEALNSSIKFKNDNPDTRLSRAQTYALMGRTDEAKTEYRAVLKLRPNDKNAKEDLAKLGG